MSRADRSVMTRCRQASRGRCSTKRTGSGSATSTALAPTGSGSIGTSDSHLQTSGRFSAVSRLVAVTIGPLESTRRDILPFYRSQKSEYQQNVRNLRRRLSISISLSSIPRLSEDFVGSWLASKPADVVSSVVIGSKYPRSYQCC